MVLNLRYFRNRNAFVIAILFSLSVFASPAFAAPMTPNQYCSSLGTSSCEVLNVEQSAPAAITGGANGGFGGGYGAYIPVTQGFVGIALLKICFNGKFITRALKMDIGPPSVSAGQSYLVRGYTHISPTGVIKYVTDPALYCNSPY